MFLAALEKAWLEGNSPEDREHVTWFVKNHPELFENRTIQPRPDWRDAPFRLALDEEDDLELLGQIFMRLYPRNPLFDLGDVFQLYRKEPGLFLLNRQVVAKT